jgi:hypothetical protein
MWATAFHWTGEKADPQDEVREGQVGQQLPVADKEVEPLDVRPSQPGMLVEELGERRHHSTLPTGSGMP